MKPLQNYIEEEIKEFEKIFGGKEHRLWLENIEMRAETDCEEELEHFLRQSLHRIAKITAEDLKQLVIEDVPHQYQERLLAKIKEFGI